MLQKVKLSTLVANQFPEFIQEEYPALTSFIEAYYKFLEQTNTRNLSSYRDIDETLDAFIVHFKNELNYNGFYTAPENDRVILKKIKEIYTAKGSEESYRLLFRLLFNKDIEIYYPYKSVLRSSDGKWNQDNSIFIVPKSGDINQIVSKTIRVMSEKNRITYVVVKKIKKINDSLYEVFIENNKYLNNITTTSTIEYNGFVGTISPTLGTYEVINPGLSFKVGESLTVSTNTKKGVINATIKVDKIDAQGGIKRISFIKFGTGYSYDFYANIQSSNTNAPGGIISINKNDGTILTSPAKTSTLGFIDEGFINLSNYWDEQYGDNTYVGDIIQTFRTEISYNLDTTNTSVDNIPPEQKMALIKFNISPIAKYQGYYLTNDGFISDSVYMEDQDYYQPYAYQIKIDESLNSYKNIIKSYLHPAGTRLFAEYQLNNVINLAPEIKSLFNYQLIEFIDTVDPTDDVVKYVNKHRDDSITTPDFDIVNVSKALTDNTPISDVNNKLVNKPTTDLANINDTNALNSSKQISDNANLTELLAKTYNTTFTENAEVSSYLYNADNYAEYGYLNDALERIEIATSTTIEDTASFSDSNTILNKKLLQDSIPIADSTSSVANRKLGLQDSVVFDDTTGLNNTKKLQDSTVVVENNSINSYKSIENSISLVDSNTSYIEQLTNDNVSVDDQLANDYSASYIDDVLVESYETYNADNYAEYSYFALEETISVVVS
jgi:hypothetical protein